MYTLLINLTDIILNITFNFHNYLLLRNKENYFIVLIYYR